MGKRSGTEDTLQPMVVELRRRMHAEDPWELLAFLSSMVAAADGRDPPDGGTHGIGDLVESFVGVDLAETTAALHVLAALVRDDNLVGDIRAELAHRSQRMPLWLSDIDDVRVERAVFVRERDGSQDDVVLGFRWAGVGEAAFLLLVDHDDGTVVKDAFPTPSGVDEALKRLRSVMPYVRSIRGRDEDARYDDVDLGDARRRVQTALAAGDALQVECESDTWPASRPILEWLLSTMPVLETGHSGT